jgi:hypothetical protein
MKKVFVKKRVTIKSLKKQISLLKKENERLSAYLEVFLNPYTSPWGGVTKEYVDVDLSKNKK